MNWYENVYLETKKSNRVICCRRTSLSLVQWKEHWDTKGWKNAVNNWLYQQPEEFYESGTHSLIRRWSEIIKDVVTIFRRRDVHLWCIVVSGCTICLTVVLISYTIKQITLHFDPYLDIFGLFELFFSFDYYKCKNKDDKRVLGRNVASITRLVISNIRKQIIYIRIVVLVFVIVITTFQHLCSLLQLLVDPGNLQGIFNWPLYLFICSYAVHI